LNLKDKANPHLRERVINDDISAAEFCQMSPTVSYYYYYYNVIIIVYCNIIFFYVDDLVSNINEILLS